MSDFAGTSLPPSLQSLLDLALSACGNQPHLAHQFVDQVIPGLQNLAAEDLAGALPALRIAAQEVSNRLIPAFGNNQEQAPPPPWPPAPEDVFLPFAGIAYDALSIHPGLVSGSGQYPTPQPLPTFSSTESDADPLALFPSLPGTEPSLFDLVWLGATPSAQGVPDSFPFPDTEKASLPIQTTSQATIPPSQPIPSPLIKRTNYDSNIAQVYAAQPSSQASRYSSVVVDFIISNEGSVQASRLYRHVNQLERSASTSKAEVSDLAGRNAGTTKQGRRLYQCLLEECSRDVGFTVTSKVRTGQKRVARGGRDRDTPQIFVGLKNLGQPYYQTQQPPKKWTTEGLRAMTARELQRWEQQNVNSHTQG
ncbi:hypothetical protein V8E36_002721 [Tilletia maclaganii]